MNVSIRGLLKLFILAEAIDNPQSPSISGKSITNTISQITNGKWKPSPGALYPILQSMEREGLLRHLSLRKKEGRGRREIHYAITKKGRREFFRLKKRGIEASQNALSTFAPVVMRIHSASLPKKDRTTVHEFSKLMARMREFMLLSPSKKRMRIFKSVLPCMRNLVEKMEVASNS